MQTILQPPVSRGPRFSELRSRFMRFRLKWPGLSPKRAKVLVVVLFTLCWFCVGLVRSYTPRETISVQGESLIGLAASMQHGTVSDQDFQSAYRSEEQAST